ncbi:MAG: DUF6175 family protein [Tannerella sp.]|jgi:hypothetical protein|nr:DUF6175 family protein [Tannerella sp.]
MKKEIFILILTIIFGWNTDVFSQPRQKKPTVMVMPSDNWCIQYGYVTEVDNMGSMEKQPDYQRALQENADLLFAISKINELMYDFGFQLKNLESVLKALKNQEAEDAMLTSKSGSEMIETNFDKLMQTARADIIMQLTWTIHKKGPERSITYNLQGLDSYSKKQIAGSSGTGNPSFAAEFPVLIEDVLQEHVPLFYDQFEKHFIDLQLNGREIALRVKVWGSFDGDLETEYDGKELGEIIEDWISDNTVERRYLTGNATANMMEFEQVHIPFFDERERPIDARNWASGLQKMLKSKYAIEAKLMMKGLGQAQLVIGEK